MDNPFSIAAFKSTSTGIVASPVIQAHADEIVWAADADDLPLSVVTPHLDGLIIERLHWSLCDKMIRDFLGSNFVPIGRIMASGGLPHYRTCYARTTMHG